MSFITKIIRQSGKNIFLIFIICVLTGCAGLEAPPVRTQGQKNKM